MKNWLLGLIFVSSLAWAAECNPPTGNTVPDGTAQVGLTDSLPEKYEVIRDYLIAQYGENGFQGQSVSFLVNVEGCAAFCMISKVYPMRFEKPCDKSIRQTMDALIAQFNKPNQESGGEGGGEGGGGSGGFEGGGVLDDPFANCYVWPGGEATTDDGKGGGRTVEYFPPQLICP